MQVLDCLMYSSNFYILAIALKCLLKNVSQGSIHVQFFSMSSETTYFLFIPNNTDYYYADNNKVSFCGYDPDKFQSITMKRKNTKHNVTFN
jgi:hypothetical protein